VSFMRRKIEPGDVPAVRDTARSFHHTSRPTGGPVSTAS
jgi:hypothetical protein